MPFIVYLDKITLFSITGNFQFEPCSHGDFLGSILGTGIVREKVGDIILQVFYSFRHLLLLPKTVLCAQNGINLRIE
jgi:RNA-binding protein YlmH